MKRLLLVFVIAFGQTTLDSAAIDKTFTLAREGTAKCLILPDAEYLETKNGKRDVEDLAYWLKQITGAEFPITATPPPEEKFSAIRLGLSKDSPEIAEIYNLKDRGPDAVALHTSSDRLYIIGNSQAAIRNGIYTVLRDWGCRWYFPNADWWSIPRKSSLDYAANRVESPDFIFGRLFYGGGSANSMSPWSERNRLTKYNEGYIAHAWNARVPSQTYFQDHPEYFASINGERKRSQLCVANEDMRKIFIDSTLKFLREHPTWKVAPVEPNDNLGFCEAPESKTIGNGSPNDQVFFLANETAKAVRNEFPDVYVGVYAYLNHAEAPSFPLEPNMYVEVTTKLRFTEKSVDEVVKDFNDSGVKVGIRDYLSVPQWNAGAIGGGSKGARYLEAPLWLADLGEKGVVGYNGEASDDWGIKGLTYYLISTLLWDHKADIKAETDRFFESMFDGAASTVRGMYDRWQGRDLTRIEFVQDASGRLRKAYRETDDPAVHQRLDDLGMLVYWNYLFYHLQQTALIDGPDAITLGGDNILRRFIDWSSRMSPKGMVDCYAVIQMLGRFQGLKQAFAEVSKREDVKLADLYNSYNGTWWKEAKEKGAPGAEEMQAAYKEMEEFFAPYELAESGKAAAFATRRLVPLKDVHPDAIAEWSGDVAKPASLIVPSGIPIGIWALAGETIVVPYGLGASVFDLKVRGGAEQHQVAWKVARDTSRETSVASGRDKLTKEKGLFVENDADSPMPAVSFTAPADGVYLVSFDSPGGAVRLQMTADLKGRPLALLPFLSEKSPFETTGPLVWSGVRSFVYLPKDCRQLVTVSTQAPGDLVMADAGGATIVDAKRFGAAALRRFPVGEPQRGRIASLAMGTLSVGFRNFPMAISPHPDQLLVPASE